MSGPQSDTAGKLLRGAVAGLVAGIVASFAMDRFQTAVAALGPSSGQENEPATEKAADGIAQTLIGFPLNAEDRPLAGQSIHYLFGLGLGVGYGIAAEMFPIVTAGYGTAFGLSTATLFDEGAVPAAGLGKAPWQTGVSGNLYSYASHLVFGGVTEIVRRHVRTTLDQ